MLSIRRLVSPTESFRGFGSSKASVPSKNSLQQRALRKYSTVRRRVVNAEKSSKPSSYSTEDPRFTEMKKKELDKDFDETFFRKPKVLIIGTDLSAMVTGTPPLSPLEPFSTVFSKP